MAHCQQEAQSGVNFAATPVGRLITGRKKHLNQPTKPEKDKSHV
jgi:hypothetical protein